MIFGSAGVFLSYSNELCMCVCLCVLPHLIILLHKWSLLNGPSFAVFEAIC